MKKFKSITSLLIASAFILSSIGNAFACTVMLYTDASGRAYVGRTMEFPGFLPARLTYYPASARFESVTPDGKQGATFNSKYPILASTVPLIASSKQDTFAEGLNDQGLSFTANSLGGNLQTNTSNVPKDKIISAYDFGAWALGNFQTVAQLKQAIANKEVDIWLPVMAEFGGAWPFHFAFFDKTGEGIVIEWTNGQTTVYDNPVGVMTNNPSFPWQLENMNNYAYLTNVDKNHGQFNKLKVSNFDGGANMNGLPGIETSPGRFVKAAYYSQFAVKGKTPEKAILLLGHVMNNFDRPTNISIDVANDLPGGERNLTAGNNGKPISEVTSFTVLKDLQQNHFYIRTIDALNYSKFDLSKLSALKTTKVLTFDAIDANTNSDATDLFFK